MAYFVLVVDQVMTVTELYKHLRTNLPEYIVPPHFVDLDALPLTPNGKVDRGALPTLFSVGGGTAENYVAPRTETEVCLARMWEQLLGIE